MHIVGNTLLNPRFGPYSTSAETTFTRRCSGAIIAVMKRDLAGKRGALEKNHTDNV